MRFGHTADTHGGPYGQAVPDRERCAAFCEELVREAVVAEESGLDGVFVPERHARTETMWPSPLTALLAMAMRTTRVALSTHVLMPALYNPAHLAEDVAILDLVSRGRLILGVGTGYHPGYFAHFGEPFDQRLGRFNEAMEFLSKAWHGERFDWQGRYWNLKDVLVSPPPYQQDGPPVWYGALADRAIVRAAEKADGIALLQFHTPLPEMRRRVDLYRTSAMRAGRTPVVSIELDGFVGTTRDHALETFGHLWVEEVRYYLRWGMIAPTDEVPDIEHATFERLEPYMLLGDPKGCAERIVAYARALELRPEDWIILRPRLPFGPGHAEVLGSIERFGREVVPMVRGALD